jgi:hypothetical protein
MKKTVDLSNKFINIQNITKTVEVTFRSAQDSGVCLRTGK